MKKIIVIVPTERESRMLLQRGIEVSSDLISVEHCGVGMAECAAATARLIVEHNPELMLLAGIAGTYTDDIEMGETLVVASETIGDMGRLSAKAAESGNPREGSLTPLFQKTYPAPLIPEGFRAVRSYTVNTAGGCVAMPLEAEIENMEGAAFFAVCSRFGVPAMEVRTVSNRVGESISAENMEIATSRLALDLEKILTSIVW